MKPAEKATNLANIAYLLSPPDLCNLRSAITLFGEAETLDEDQKSLLERSVDDAIRAYIPNMPRDETYTRDAVSAYSVLFDEGKLEYEEVDPSKILVSASMYFRRAEQLKIQAKSLEKSSPRDSVELNKEGNKHYKLGLLESQIYLGKEMQKGRLADFSEVGTEITKLDRETFPGFREIVVTDYVLDGLKEAYNLQKLGRIQ